MLTTRIQTLISDHNLVTPGDTWLVAVSGGTDSLALLHLLYTLCSRFSLNVHIATYDHGLRGDESAADARFVVETAQGMGMPVTAGRGDVRRLAAEHGESIEAAARRARYDFLARIARTTNAAAVVTAHHADDQAETVLMHMLRGSGLNGLRGMAVSGSVPGHPDIRLLRPLLNITRAELEAYCHEHGLMPREDATNTDTAYLRNRIRHEIMPHLRQINPQVEAALLRLAENATIDSAYLDEQAHEATRRLLSGGGERFRIEREGFALLHPALQRRVIRQAVARLTDESAAHEHILDAVRIGITGEQGAIVQFPGGVQIRVDYIALIVEKTGAAPPVLAQTPLLRQGQIVHLNMPGTTLIPGADWSLVASESPGQHKAAAVLYVPPQAKAILRTRRPGERFRPCGMNGHTRSIKKWMIDRKIPRHLRDRIPILEINDEIAAILTRNQWHIDEKWAKTDEKLTKTYLFINYS